MREMLEMLREKNPALPLFSVLDEEFRRYGRVLSADTKALSAALAATPIPEEGNCYVASLPALEAVDLMPGLQRTVFGEMPIQAGYCNGNGFKLNALEYHKCSEINFTTTGLVLLLALPEQLDDGRLDSADVVGFYLPENVLVEIAALRPLPGQGDGLPLPGRSGTGHQRGAPLRGHHGAGRGEAPLDAQQVDDLPPGLPAEGEGRVRRHQRRKSEPEDLIVS